MNPALLSFRHNKTESYLWSTWRIALGQPLHRGVPESLLDTPPEADNVSGEQYVSKGILIFNNTCSGTTIRPPKILHRIPNMRSGNVQHLSETVTDRIEAIIEPEKWYIG